MARLLLVRHGQASFMSDDYDKLSPHGVDQMRRLGAHLAATELSVDRVLVGPLVRQRGSCDALLEAMRGQGAAPPDAAEARVLDEFDALAFMMKAIPKLVQGGDPDVAPLAHAAIKRGPDQAMAKERLFRFVTGRWVRGLIATPEGVESFDAFRERVESGLTTELLAGERGETVVAVSSGGVIGAVMGWALGLDDVRTLELSWIVRNSSVTELLYTRDDDHPRGIRVSLHVFNTVPHLREAALITYR